MAPNAPFVISKLTAGLSPAPNRYCNRRRSTATDVIGESPKTNTISACSFCDWLKPSCVASSAPALLPPSPAMFIADEELALLFGMLLSIILGTLLGFCQRVIKLRPGTFSLISLAGSTCTSVFLFAGMTASQLVQELIFLALVAAPISGFLLMRLVADRRMQELELLLCAGLAAAVGVTSGLGNYVLAVIITVLAPSFFWLLRRFSS